MNNWLNRIFAFRKKEQNGLIVLCILICIVVFLPAIYKVCYPPDVYVVELPAGGALQQEEYVLQERNYRSLEDSRKDDRGRRPASAIVSELFPFNPNRLPASEWRRLGLSDRQIQVIHHYEDKGGTFRRKEDLQKMYSISESKYQELAPYVQIPEPSKPFFEKEQERRSAEILRSVRKARPSVELNTADSAALVEVRGIGPVLALRILQYRSRLGGFMNVAQLREVYGIDSSRYVEISGQLRVDSTLSKKIYINRVGFDELKQFPYLRYKQINAIVQYRKQHGRYACVEDLTKINILDTEILRKIAPYLVFDD
ncbi:MAG: ComEA family DNA-binding protein [Arcticibacter sp.]